MTYANFPLITACKYGFSAKLDNRALRNLFLSLKMMSKLSTLAENSVLISLGSYKRLFDEYLYAVIGFIAF
jgi:hypothetical protein